MAEPPLPADPRDSPAPPPMSPRRKTLRLVFGPLACLGAAFAGWTLYEQVTTGTPAFAARIAICVALFVAAGILTIYYALLANLFAIGLALVLAGAPDTDWLLIGIGAYLLTATLAGLWLTTSQARERATYVPLVETLIQHGSRHPGEVAAIEDAGNASDGHAKAAVTVTYPGGTTTLTREFSVIHIPRVGDPVLVLRTTDTTGVVFAGDREHRAELRRQLKAARQ
ncbi:hypothetical protein [Actinokineospora globicatena]|nr:hypothetical protein [Actinokineospora globicatena]